jgi:predicted amidohydrolase YtcJ
LRRTISFLALIILPAAACARGEQGPRADLILVNGKIVTVDAGRPAAQAIAVTGDRITAVGSDADIRPLSGPKTDVIDLHGRLAVPGFIEGHGHFLGLGQAKTVLDLSEARTWAAIVETVAAAAKSAAPGEWIQGQGWHQEKWERPPQPAILGNPVHAGLSSVSPNNPVYLTHASGHAGFANARAMQLASIGKNAPNPPGGYIARDDRGEPTGLLLETAQGLVTRVIAEFDARRTAAEREGEARRRVALASGEALANGITSFQDAGSAPAVIDLFERLADEGALPVRLYVMLRVGSQRAESVSNDRLDELLPRYRAVGYGHNFLTVRSIKRQIDGALGSYGAWLLEPYSDLHRANTGLVLEPVADIERTAELAIRHGYQLNTHAIGDRANREVLNLYERTFRAHPDKKDLRWRIEHAQHLNPADVSRFAQLGIIASMQAIHAVSDGPWVPERIGLKRAEEGAYLWRSLIESGAVVTNGTDVPVEKINPIAGFHAAVTRRMANGTVFFAEQRLTRDQALRGYTISSAYAAFEEDLKGSLVPGKLADIVVLSRDIMTVPEDEIRETRVDYTIIGGRVKYRRH